MKPHAVIERYRVVKPVVLGFIVDNEQEDWEMWGGDEIQREGGTLYFAHNDRRSESITEAHAVDVWLSAGLIERIP